MTRANKALLTLLVALALWHGDTALKDLLQPKPVIKPVLTVQRASAVSLLSCTPEGKREWERVCRARARMTKVGAK